MKVKDNIVQLYSGSINLSNIGKRSRKINPKYSRLIYLFTGFKEVSENACIYDTTTGKYLYCDDEAKIGLWKAVQESAAFNPPVSKYVPIVEVFEKYSNFTFEVASNDAKSLGLQGYELINKADAEMRILGLAEDIQTACMKLFSVKTALHLLVYSRFVKCEDGVRRLVYKFHLPNILLSLPAKLKLADELSEAIDEYYHLCECYIPKFNEFHETTVTPYTSPWNMQYTLNMRPGLRNKITVAIIDSLLDEVDTSIGLFSVNASIASFEKNIIITPDDNNIVEDSNSAHKLRTLLLNNIHAKFYNIMLKFIDIKYKTDKECWKQLLHAFKADPIAKLLLRNFTLENAATLFPEPCKCGCEHYCDNCALREHNNEWFKLSHHDNLGFFVYEILKGPNRMAFKDARKEFLNDYIESQFYDKNGNFGQVSVARLLHFKYFGKYYTVPRQNATKQHPFDIYGFVDKKDEGNPKLLYKWRLEIEPHDVYKYTRDVLAGIYSEQGQKFNTGEDIKKGSALSKDITKYSASINKFESPAFIGGAVGEFSKFNINRGFEAMIDTEPTVVGVINGILDLDLNSANPQPVMVEGYSRYIVTKCANARYIPYEICKQTNKYIAVWKGIYRDSIIERDARKKIQYFDSTFIDGKANLTKILEELGIGANGKSVRNDNLLYVCGEYGRKLSSNILSAKSEGSKADPEMMDVKGFRGGIIAETNFSDVLVSSRLKTITEDIISGRNLFTGMDNFDNFITAKICTNYDLQIIDQDEGTWRRIIKYVCKMRFVEEPDPNNPIERKANLSYRKLAKTNSDAADALFSLLVHWRIKFHKRFGSNIDAVPSPTIDKETKSYRYQQDTISRFVHTKVVILEGYTAEGKLHPSYTKEKIESIYSENNINIDHVVTLNSIAQRYVAWLEYASGEKQKLNLENVSKSLGSSLLAKYIFSQDGIEYVGGVRVLEKDSTKIKGEMFLV